MVEITYDIGGAQHYDEKYEQDQKSYSIEKCRSSE